MCNGLTKCYQMRGKCSSRKETTNIDYHSEYAYVITICNRQSTIMKSATEYYANLELYTCLVINCASKQEGRLTCSYCKKKRHVNMVQKKVLTLEKLCSPVHANLA